ncbi:hypothetical protein AB1E18_014200 [Capra hircus]
MSRRTSTTRAYKSRRASRAAGGERARAQHSRQCFDVKGRVPVRKRPGREGLETRGRKSSSAPSCGRRSHPARAARRHLGSRLLTARAALSNSLQSRPPTPGPASGPRTRPPAAPPAPRSPKIPQPHARCPRRRCPRC